MNENELEEEFEEMADDLVAEAESIPDITKARIREGLRIVVKTILKKVSEISEELDDNG